MSSLLEEEVRGIDLAVVVVLVAAEKTLSSRRRQRVRR